MKTFLIVAAVIVVSAVGYILYAIRDWERKGGL